MIIDKIFKALEALVLELDTDDSPLAQFSLDLPGDLGNGDYSSNIAFILAKKKSQAPVELAQEIANKLMGNEELKELIEEIKVAPPGFVNFFVSKKYISSQISEVGADTDLYKKLDLGNKKKVLVEYSSPNIAKNFSVGHLRSTIIGQALVNLFKKTGYEVIGENHLGDWGTQFGMVIAAIKRGSVDIESITLSKLEELYVQFNSESKVNPKLRDEAKAWFKKLEQGDKEARSIWEKVTLISKNEFDRVYEVLGVKIDQAHGESFYEDKMQAVIDEVVNKNLCRESEGAKIVEYDPEEKLPPAMLVKSDGTTTYFTRDLAAVRYRIDNFDPDIFIYEVGAEQMLHFRQLFKTVEKLGWATDKKFIHIPHGLVLVGGKKMSTREGTNIGVEEVLNESIQRAKKLGSESEDLAKKVGIGAVKYFDLSHHPTSNINFDWEKMLSLEGNSGPYLQYTHARAVSVLDKAAKDNGNVEKVVLGQNELELARKILRFDEVIVLSTQMYSPNILCEYLFDLSRIFNKYYSENKILDTENVDSKLILVKSFVSVLKEGLELLGIEAPNRM